MTNQNHIFRLCLIGIFTAILSVLSPFSLPVGTVSVNAATLGLFLAAAVLGAKDGTIAVGVYLLLGLIGVPVFAGFQGGVSVLAGPSGGFLLGYLPCTAISGWLILRFWRKRPLLWGLALVIGNCILYLCGAGWFCLQTKATAVAALIWILPFVPLDIVKIGCAVILSYPLRTYLYKRKNA